MGRPRRTPAGSGISPEPSVDIDTDALGGEVEGGPLARALDDGMRVTSKTQATGGILSLLNDVPDELNQSGGCGMDPNGRGFIYVGGRDTEGVPVRYYDLRYGFWTDERYSDFSDDIELVDEDVELASRPAVFPIGETVYVMGGDPQNENAPPTAIYYYDHSATDPQWEVHEEQLPQPIEGPPHAVHEDEAYIFGPGAAMMFDGESFVDLSEPPLGGLKYGNKAPIVDGEIYLQGEWFANGTGDDRQMPFYKYNIENDEYTKLADVEAFFWEGDEEAEDATAEASMYHHDGHLVLQDGHMWYGGTDIAYYSIEDDRWIGLDAGSNAFDDGVLADYLYGGDTPWQGNKTGVKYDGVYYSPAPGMDGSCLYVHKPRSDPFDYTMESFVLDTGMVLTHWDGGQTKLRYREFREESDYPVYVKPSGAIAEDDRINVSADSGTITANSMGQGTLTTTHEGEEHTVEYLVEEKPVANHPPTEGNVVEFNPNEITEGFEFVTVDDDGASTPITSHPDMVTDEHFRLIVDYDEGTLEGNSDDINEGDAYIISVGISNEYGEITDTIVVRATEDAE